MILTSCKALSNYLSVYLNMKQVSRHCEVCQYCPELPTGSLQEMLGGSCVATVCPVFLDISQLLTEPAANKDDWTRVSRLGTELQLINTFDVDT